MSTSKAKGTFEARSHNYGEIVTTERIIRYPSHFPELRIIATNNEIEEGDIRSVILALRYEAIKVGIHTVAEEGNVKASFNWGIATSHGVSGSITITALDIANQHVAGNFSFNTTGSGTASGKFDLTGFVITDSKN